MLRSLIPVLLVGCAELPEPAELPEADDAARRASGVSLVAGTLVRGDRTRFLVTARPGDESVWLLAGTGVRPRGITCVGSDPRFCTTLQGASIVGGAALEPDGTAEFFADPPASLVPGETWWVQVVVDGTRRVSAPIPLTVSDPIAVAGAWTDDFGGQRDVSSLTWFDYGTHDVLRFDNAARWAIARNGADTFSPGAFSRFDWTEAGGDAWYCQSAYDAATFAEALATPAADATDPASGGCGFGFPWTRLLPTSLALAGTYTDAFGTTHGIDDTTWADDFGTYHITRYSNARRFVVAQNDANNAFFPGLWSRFDWHEDGDDRWYCQSEYDELAETNAAYDLGFEPGTWLPDPSSPDVCGCGAPCPGGFPWTHLTP